MAVSNNRRNIEEILVLRLNGTELRGYPRSKPATREVSQDASSTLRSGGVRSTPERAYFTKINGWMHLQL